MSNSFCLTKNLVLNSLGGYEFLGKRQVRDSNPIQANGPGAGQSVQHYHIHIMPRYAGDEDLKINWGLTQGDMDEIKATYENIARCLG